MPLLSLGPSYFLQTIFAEWSGRVWQPSAESNGHLAHFFSNLKRTERPLLYYLQRAVTPTQQVQIYKKKCAKRPLLSAVGCRTRPDHSAE